jgi:hypothetical protein
MESTLLSAGILCLIAAVVGGGLAFSGATVPVINSPGRQAMLASLGVVFIALAFHQSLATLLLPSPVTGPGGNVQSEEHPTSGFGFIYLGMRDGDKWANNKYAYGPVVSVDTVPHYGDEVKIVQPVHLRQAVPSATDPLVMSNDLGILERGTKVRIKTVTKVTPGEFYWAGVDVLGK